jgi:hypothetical protein
MNASFGLLAPPSIAVAITAGVLLAVFLPKQFDGDLAVLLQLLTDLKRSRLRPVRRFGGI